MLHRERRKHFDFEVDEAVRLSAVDETKLYFSKVMTAAEEDAPGWPSMPSYQVRECVVRTLKFLFVVCSRQVQE